MWRLSGTVYNEQLLLRMHRLSLEDFEICRQDHKQTAPFKNSERLEKRKKFPPKNTIGAALEGWTSVWVGPENHSVWKGGGIVVQVTWGEESKGHLLWNHDCQWSWTEGRPCLGSPAHLTAVPSFRARAVPTHPFVYAIYLLPGSYQRELYTWQFENKGKQRADTTWGHGVSW